MMYLGFPSNSSRKKIDRFDSLDVASNLEIEGYQTLDTFRKDAAFSQIWKLLLHVVTQAVSAVSCLCEDAGVETIS